MLPVHIASRPCVVVPGRVELPTSTLSVWRSNQLSYRTGLSSLPRHSSTLAGCPASTSSHHIRKTDIKRTREEKRSVPLFPEYQDHLSRKEVFQPHLPVRLPCYDLAPITSFTLGRSLRLRTSGTPGFHGLTGGVYKARERIHRAMADARLLANPASWSRVADSSPN